MAGEEAQEGGQVADIGGNGMEENCRSIVSQYPASR